MYEMSRAAKPIDRDGAVAVCLDTTGIEEVLLMGTQFLWVGEQDENTLKLVGGDIRFWM